MKAKERYAYYGGRIVACADRLLSALNRCPVSASGGCLDREYWAWCTKDFANMDRQRGVLVLAYLYATPFEGNPHAGVEAVRDWAVMAGDFWARELERKNGLDHLYAWEDSWMAAGFTLADVVAAFDLLDGRMAEPSRRLWLQGMRAASERLAGGDELHGFISNHRLGAAAGLLGSGRLTGDSRYAQRAASLVGSVLDHQSPEGFFLEYEGADPGYETLGLHYASRVVTELGKASFAGAAGLAERLSRAVERSVAFLSHFVHPDGSIGGDYGSRGCMHFFPAGMEHFGRENPLAESACRTCCRGLSESRCSGLHDSDERNETPLATSYVYAHASLRDADDRPAAALPWTTEYRTFFPQAGILAWTSARYQMVLGAARGGVLRVYDKRTGRLAYSDYGYSGVTRQGASVSSFHPPLQAEVRLPAEGESGEDAAVTVRTPFCEFDASREMTTSGLLAFRLFSATLGRISFFSDVMRKAIIARHVTRKRTVPVFLCRSVALHGDRVAVEDRIEGSGLVRDVRRHGFLATSYMASARYFKLGDHCQAWTEEVGDLPEGERLVREIRPDHAEDAV